MNIRKKMALGWMGMTLAAAVGCAGVDNYIVEADQLGFTPLLHKNLTSLTTEEEQNPRRPFLSNGNLAARPDLSDLIPVHADLNDEALTRFHNSLCYWSGGENFSASWEATISGVANAAKTCGPDLLGACNVAHPITRERLTCNGGGVILQPWAPSSALTVRVRACGKSSKPLPNPDNECQVLDSECSEYSVDDRCIAPASDDVTLRHNFPFCTLGCTMPVRGDAQLQLVVRERAHNPKVGAPDDEGVMASKFIGPTIRQVRTFVTLARPLSYHHSENGSAVFYWTVDEVNGLWRENFSPSTHISRIRAFSRDPSGNKIYASLNQVVFGGGVHFCYAVTGRTSEVNSDQCPMLGQATPTYYLNGYDTKLDWAVFARDVTPQTRLFIEFTVVNQSSPIEGVALLSPASVDFGTQVIPVSQTFSNAFEVLNLGGTDLTVTGLEIRGADSGFFEAKTSRGLPATFHVDENLPIIINALAQPVGEKHLTLRVTMSSGQVLVAPFTIRIAEQLMLFAPETELRLYANESDRSQNRDYSNVVVINPGQVDVRVDTVDIVGPDAIDFALEISPARPFTLVAGGGSGTFRVRYIPSVISQVPPPPGTVSIDGTRMHFARLRARGTGGEIFLDLVGQFDRGASGWAEGAFQGLSKAKAAGH